MDFKSSNSPNSKTLYSSRILIILSFVAVFRGHAQVDEASINGKWVYGSIRRIDEAEPISAFSLRMVAGPNGLYQFLPNHRFKTCERTCVNGTWKFDKSTNRISLFTDAGGIVTFMITRADKDTLMFNVRNKAIHTLTRVSDAQPFRDSVQVNPPKGKKFKARQLEGRWKTIKISEEKNVPEQFRPATRIFKNWIYIFSKDGNVVSAHYETRNGTWKIDRDGSLVIMYGEEGEFWHIVSLSKTEMILKKPGIPNLYTFKAEVPEPKEKKTKVKEYVEPVQADPKN